MSIVKFSMAVCAIALMSGSANATSFDFTDTVSGGHIVTGSFDGTLSGNLITDLTNLVVFVDGNAFAGNGSLDIYHHDAEGPGWILGGGVVSLDGTANSFLFADGGFTNYFFSYSIGDNETVVFDNGAYGGLEPVSQLRVTAHQDDQTSSPAPEPASWAMMLAGFGLVGGALRSRRKVAVAFN